MENLTPQELLAAAQRLVAEVPNASLVKNEVGNLAIIDGDAYIGWVDLRTGEVEILATA
ncbi:MAG TPA: hypothetical protein VIQ30_02600 [Pseudonocardia sp.]